MELTQWLKSDSVWGHLIRIALFFILAWIAQRFARRLAQRVVRLSRFSAKTRRPRPERQATLQSLIASSISYTAFAVAGLATVGQFVRADTLVWMVGLFSAAFGLGAHPLISDVLSGIGLIFEDTFAVGEKVEILNIEGVVEAVNLRTTWLRAQTGELYVVPNGQVRIVRNFSRGRFSIAKIKLKIPAAEIGRALPILENLGQEAVVLLPSLLEPWQVLSESGEMGQQTELMLLVKARFGQAAETRPRLLALVQERLSEAEIPLSD